MNVSWNHYWRPACAAFPMCRRWSQTARVNRRTHPPRADACGPVPGKTRSRKRFGGPRQVGTEIAAEPRLIDQRGKTGMPRDGAIGDQQKLLRNLGEDFQMP